MIVADLARALLMAALAAVAAAGVPITQSWPGARGLVFPASIGGIVAGSLIAAPMVALLGLTGALAATGLFVLAACALLLHRPLDVAADSALPAVASA